MSPDGNPALRASSVRGGDPRRYFVPHNARATLQSIQIRVRAKRAHNNKEKIDTDRRRRLLEDIRERDEEPDAGGTIVGAQHRLGAVRKIRVFVCDGSCVPVRDVKDALWRLRIEPSDDVLEFERRAVLRRLWPALDEHRIRSPFHFSDDPPCGAVVRRCAWSTRADGEMLFRITEGRITVEGRLRSGEAVTKPHASRRGCRREQERQRMDRSRRRGARPPFLRQFNSVVSTQRGYAVIYVSA